MDNALKYAPDCPTVRVAWGVEKANVAIRVQDRGPGIPASEKRAIFQKFVRGSAAEAANVKGSGVGLAMVRHIVAAHGGSTFQTVMFSMRNTALPVAEMRPASMPARLRVKKPGAWPSVWSNNILRISPVTVVKLLAATHPPTRHDRLSVAIRTAKKIKAVQTPATS